MSTLATVTNNANNGGIASISDFFGKLADTALDIGKQIIPVWAAKQLNDQKSDQLAFPVYQTQQPPANSTTQSATNTPPTVASGLVINNSALLLIGGAILAVVLIARD